MGLSSGGGLHWLKGWEFSCLLSDGDSFASCSFGGTFWETIFLVEGYHFFVFLSFGSYWLIVTWCIVLLLHPLPSVLLGLFVHLQFSFSASRLRHESWGGVGVSLYRGVQYSLY
jgi:hypothetical protein